MDITTFTVLPRIHILSVLSCNDMCSRTAYVSVHLRPSGSSYSDQPLPRHTQALALVLALTVAGKTAHYMLFLQRGLTYESLLLPF